MHKFRNFSVQHPLAFGFVLLLIFTILSTLTWPITQIYPYPEGYEIGTAAAKLVIAACLILILWRFGWLKTAGFTSLGSKQIWLFVIPLMIYKAVFGLYAFTGNFNFKLPEIELTLAILLFTFSTSLVEETLYRGLLLRAMVKAWASTRRGLMAAAILSGLFWSALHFINLMIRPFPVVALQVLETTISGFFYAAIVLSGRSIWPAIVFHWAINATINLQASQMANFEETISAWVILNLAALPLVIAGTNLLQKVKLKSESGEGQTQANKQLESIHAKTGIMLQSKE